MLVSFDAARDAQTTGNLGANIVTDISNQRDNRSLSKSKSAFHQLTERTGELRKLTNIELSGVEDMVSYAMLVKYIVSV